MQSWGPEPGGDPARRLLLALMSVLRQVKRQVPDAGLDAAGVMVLHMASCSTGARISDLAQVLGLDASTVSRHVKNLEEGGFLERSADPADRRASRIDISSHGRRVLEAAQSARAARLAAATVDWPAADRTALVGLLERLAADVDSVTAVSTSPVPAGTAPDPRGVATR